MKSIQLFFHICFIFNSLNSNDQVKILPFFDSYSALRFIKKYLPEDPIILEAGAYDGADSLKMMRIWPNCIIHAFEPVPLIYKWLKKNTSNYKNIICYQLALSNKDGIADFYISEDPNLPNVPTTSGSLLKPKEHLKIHHYIFKNVVPVKTIRLDSWAQKNNIQTIDLLWLDMQGFELFALKEGLNVLKNVKVIYIETEFIEAYAGQPLYSDVKKWLESQGFILIAQDAEKQTNVHWCCNLIFIRKI